NSLSHSAAVILQAVANGYRYGFDIMDVTGLPSGSVYPALRRMELAGLVESKWEPEGLAQDEGRPPRKYYEVTTSGTDALAEALKQHGWRARWRRARNQRPARERGGAGGKATPEPPPGADRVEERGCPPPLPLGLEAGMGG